MTSACEGTRHALLSDSQATLRQVRNVLADFASPGPGGAPSAVDRALSGPDTGASELADLVKGLVSAYADVPEVAQGVERVLLLVEALKESPDGGAPTGEARSRIREELLRAAARVADRRDGS